MPKTTVVSSDRVQKVVSRTRSALDKKFLDLLRGDHLFCFGNRVTQAQAIDAVRWASEMIPESFESEHIRNIILSSLNDSETTQGSSAVVCIAVLLELLKDSGEIDDRLVLDDIIAISKTSRRNSTAQILSSISRMNRDPQTRDTLGRILESCGSNGTIQVVAGPGSSSIVRSKGYKFPVTFPEIFVSSASASGSKRMTRAKIMCVDGIIEEMSEIDGVVSESYSRKSPLVIFARGFSADVQNTLGVNYCRRHLQVIPVSVTYDEMGVHLMSDICSVCDASLVSSEKGETITSRKWSDLNEVDQISVSFSQGAVTIENEKTSALVRSTRKILREERIRQDTAIVSEILDRRLMCLLGQGSIVTIGTDCGDLSGIYRDRISTSIRTFKSCARYGMVNVSQISIAVEDQRIKSGLLTLSQFFDTIGVSSVITGIRTAFSCAKLMRNVGAIVCSDRN